MMRQKAGGFTLTELMVVIAIIGILAAVGYPAYKRSIKTSERADAGLLRLAGQMEEYYMNNDSYAGADVTTLLGSNQTKEGKYTLAVSSATPFAYLLTATPNAGDPDCGRLTLSSRGEKGSTAGNPKDCW